MPELQRRDRPVEGKHGSQIIFNQESLRLTDAYAQGKETRWMSSCREWTLTPWRVLVPVSVQDTSRVLGRVEHKTAASCAAEHPSSMAFNGGGGIQSRPNC